MNEDQYRLPNNSNDVAKETDPEAVYGSGRVYEISEDLNISPVEEVDAGASENSQVAEIKIIRPVMTKVPKDPVPKDSISKPVSSVETHVEPPIKTDLSEVISDKPKTDLNSDSMIIDSISSALNESIRGKTNPTQEDTSSLNKRIIESVSVPGAESMPESISESISKSITNSNTIDPVESNPNKIITPKINTNPDPKGNSNPISIPKTPENNTDEITSRPVMKPGELNPTPLTSQKKYVIPKNPNIKPIRTYESDIADLLATKGISKAKIAIAESERKIEERVANNPVKKQPNPIVETAEQNIKTEQNSQKRKDSFLDYNMLEEVPLPSKIPLDSAVFNPTIEKTELEDTASMKTVLSLEEQAKLMQSATQKELPPKQVPTEQVPIQQNQTPVQEGNVMPDNIEINSVEQVPVSEFQKTSNHRGLKIFSVFLSIFLIGGGLALAVYLYLNSALAPIPGLKNSNVQGLQNKIIEADSTKTLSVQNRTTDEIASLIQTEISNPSTPNTVKEIVITETKSGEEVRITSQDMIEKMKIETPSILKRSLLSQWMLGVYTTSQNTNVPFVIVRTNFFQNTFAGMLQWEDYMASELDPYIFPNASIVSGTDASSTPTVYPFTGKFEDRIIQNRDVRAYVNQMGETLFIYSFLDSEKMVVTSNENALIEIISRLERQAYVR